MTKLNVQLVFQGGGAKLVALMAAAQAVYDASEKIKVTRISGTSAGALAGCMLATGKDPELFRQSMLRLAEKDWPQIKRKAGTLRLAVDLVRGIPLYNSEQYKAFLYKLFNETARVSHMRELEISCLFHASDIQNGMPKIFDGTQADHTIKEALFCSSALPFIFETYSGSPYVDGGLINNFPSDQLNNGEDDILGFGFKRFGTYDFKKGAFEYSKALIFTAMDVAVERSLEKLPKDRVKYIETDIETLEFDKAIEQLKNIVTYNNYVRQVREFLNAYIEKQKE